MIKLCCPDCKSLNVHVQAWVDVNTSEYKGDLTDEPVYWCEKCQETKYEIAERIIKKKKKKS